VPVMAMWSSKRAPVGVLVLPWSKRNAVDLRPFSRRG
jgi:hypothetical protein